MELEQAKISVTENGDKETQMCDYEIVKEVLDKVYSDFEEEKVERVTSGVLLALDMIKIHRYGHQYMEIINEVGITVEELEDMKLSYGDEYIQGHIDFINSHS